MKRSAEHAVKRGVDMVGVGTEWKKMKRTEEEEEEEEKKQFPILLSSLRTKVCLFPVGGREEGGKGTNREMEKSLFIHRLHYEKHIPSRLTQFSEDEATLFLERRRRRRRRRREEEEEEEEQEELCMQSSY